MISKKLSYVLLGIGLISIIIGYFFEFIFESIFYFALILTIILSSIAIIPHWRNDHPDPMSSEGSHSNQFSITVFTGLYAVMGALAITKTVEFTFTKIISSLNPELVSQTLLSQEIIWNAIQINYSNIILTIIFLVTAIPFYHGAMSYLSNRLEQDKQKPSHETAFHFSVLFFQAIIFLGIAFSLESITFVVTLLIGLMILDSVWIIIGQKTMSKPKQGWLCLNLAFTSGLLLILHSNEFHMIISLLLVITIIRSVVDYVGFPTVYSTQ